eukprot:TRINITY_DN114570_c0_g1_i1.p1 TRINITY_DN114570_c0_g1~~TRINITY_DN114570_c0_g1_i1.p1  ORF type:complete len:312 (-),score=53.75 TRINITY_DN114570_c0_g1_i1:113-1048(-)
MGAAAADQLEAQDITAARCRRRVDRVSINFRGCPEASVPMEVKKHLQDQVADADTCPVKLGRTVWSHVELEDSSADACGQEQHRAEFWLRNFAAVPSGSATGGHLWSAGVQLARLVFALRSELHGKRVVELGCGLGLPSLVATKFAAEVAATDVEKSLTDNLEFNIKANTAELAERLRPLALDFTSLQGLDAVGMRSWDVVLFADAILNAQCGLALPHVVRALLRDKGASAICFGAFPDVRRAGETRFWEHVRHAGLCAEEILITSWARIYSFTVSGSPVIPLRDVLNECGSEGEGDSDAEVTPLFHGIID